MPMHRPPRRRRAAMRSPSACSARSSGRSTRRSCTSANGSGLYRRSPTAVRRPPRSSPSEPGSMPGTPASGWSTRPSAASSTSTTSTRPRTSVATRCPHGHAEVLIDPESVALLAPLTRFMVGTAQRMPEILEAYRTGAGIDWADYGPDVIEAQEAMQPAPFPPSRRRRGSTTCRTSRRASGPVAGSPMSRAGPAGRRSRSPSTSRASRSTGSTSTRGPSSGRERTRPTRGHRRPRQLPAPPTPPPPTVPAATTSSRSSRRSTTCRARSRCSQAARRLLAPGGAVLIADERVAERFTAPGDAVERLFYGFSVVGCLRQRPVRAAVRRRRDGHPAVDASRRSLARRASRGFTILPTEHETLPVLPARSVGSAAAGRAPANSIRADRLSPRTHVVDGRERGAILAAQVRPV